MIFSCDILCDLLQDLIKKRTVLTVLLTSLFSLRVIKYKSKTSGSDLDQDRIKYLFLNCIMTGIHYER